MQGWHYYYYHFLVGREEKISTSNAKTKSRSQNSSETQSLLRLDLATACLGESKGSINKD